MTTATIERPATGDRRLVYVTQGGDRYHLIPHHDHHAATWTQRFAENGLRYKPCQQCFRGRRPRHRGELVEHPNKTIEWRPRGKHE